MCICPHLCVSSGGIYVYTNIYIFTCVHIFIHMFTTMCQLECYQTCIHTYIRTCIHAYLMTDRLTTTPRPYAALRPHGHGVLDTCRHHDDANIVSKMLHHHLCQHQLVCRIAVPELGTASIAYVYAADRRQQHQSVFNPNHHLHCRRFAKQSLCQPCLPLPDKDSSVFLYPLFPQFHILLQVSLHSGCGRCRG